MIVLCIGTNNHGHSADETFEGILAIVSAMRERQAKANIIVVVRIKSLCKQIDDDSVGN